MEDSTAENTGVGIAPAISPEAETERKLANEIRELWAFHVAAKTTVKKTKEEIKATRQRLSERLCEMKQLLVKPGRSGGWSSFLRSQGIAKATADRLVREREVSLGTQTNVVTEEIPEPSYAEVGRFFDSLWPRLDRKLSTPRSAFNFVCWSIGRLGLAYEKQNKGLLVFYPRAESSGTATSAPASTEQVAGQGNSGEAIQ